MLVVSPSTLVIRIPKPHPPARPAQGAVHLPGAGFFRVKFVPFYQQDKAFRLVPEGSLNFLQLFRDPGKQRQAGRIEHSVRDHGGPDGSVENHDQPQSEANQPCEQNGDQSHAEMSKAKHDGRDGDGGNLTRA